MTVVVIHLSYSFTAWRVCRGKPSTTSRVIKLTLLIRACAIRFACAFTHVSSKYHKFPLFFIFFFSLDNLTLACSKPLFSLFFHFFKKKKMFNIFWNCWNLKWSLLKMTSQNTSKFIKLPDRNETKGEFALLWMNVVGWHYFAL